MWNNLGYAPNRFFYPHLRTVMLFFSTKDLAFVYHDKSEVFAIFHAK